MAREPLDFGHGAFTYYFLEYWKVSPGVTVGGLFEYIAKHLKDKELPAPVRGGVEEGRLILRAGDEAEPSPEEKIERQTAEKQARLRAMLSNHSSFMRDRLQGFVGREAELAEIRRRIAEKQATGGYVTITGQAGQGKSAVMARLVNAAGPDTVAHHFIPFSPGPDHQVSLLRDLMARLILKHNLPEIYVAGESRAALRDFFPNLLAEIAKRGQQETICIDGLDQIEPDSNGTRDLSFLPTDPPPGIVFVLSTRPDDTLRPLELRKALAEYKLPALTRTDFDYALEGRGLHLDPSMVTRVYGAMGGNALYLHLVVEELAATGAATPDEIIRRVADDPNNLFSLSIDRFKRAGQIWREVIRPVLGLLLAAQEPLLPAHLRTILGLDHSDLRDGLRRLGGLVAKDGQGRRYLFHLKLRDYLREDPSNPNDDFVFAADEEADFHRRLADWCERGGLPAIRQDTKSDPAEQGRREYARQHYITHLYHAGHWDHLASVLDAGDYGQAKVRQDPSTRSYAQDLDLGRQAAARPDLGLEEGLARLPHLWRYTLLRTSLASRADNYPDAAFPTLVLLGREQEAIGLAELLTDATKKALALGRIAEQLQKREDRAQEARVLLLRAYEILSQLSDGNHKVAALELLLTISNLRDNSLTRQAEAIVHTIDNDFWRIRALGALAEALATAGQTQRATQVLSSAEAAADTIINGRIRIRALGALAGALATAGQTERAETIARALDDASERGKTLVAITKVLATSGLLKRAESIAFAISHASARAEALGIVARALDTAGQIERAIRMFNAAEEVARTIKDYSVRTRVLGVIASALTSAGQTERASQVLKAAESVACSIRGASVRAQALGTVAMVLATTGQIKQAAQVLTVAEDLSRVIEDAAERGKTLELIVRSLATAGQTQHAEVVAQAIANDAHRARALGRMVKSLATVGQIERAEAIALTIKDHSAQAEALGVVAAMLTVAGQTERAAKMFADAEAVADAIEDAAERVRALGSVARALTSAGQTERASQVFVAAEAVAPTIGSDFTRARVLGAVVRALASIGQIEHAEVIAHTITNDYWQARALGAIARAMTDVGQIEQAAQVLATAETIARAITTESERVRALGVVARALATAGQIERAETIALAIDDATEQGRTLEVVGRALATIRQTQSSGVIANTIGDPFEQGGALEAMVKVLATAGQINPAEVIAPAITDDSNRARVLTRVAAELVENNHIKWSLLLAQGSLLKAATRNSALDHVAVASPLIQVKPELGMAFFEAFAWVDKFLQG